MELNYYNRLFAQEDNRYMVNPNIYISNSLLSTINPEQGGAPDKFIEFLSENKEEKDTKALKTGKLIHKYIENPDEFIVADFDMPTGMKPAFIEEAYKIGIKQLDDMDENLYNSCATIAGYKRKPKIEENDQKYLEYLWNSEDKIAIDAKTKETLSRMKDSLHKHPRVSEYLFGEVINVGQTQYVLNKDFKRFNEFAIYWSEKKGTRTIYKKALIDCLLYFPVTNWFIILDIKSTGSSIFSFSSSDIKKGTFEGYRMYRQLAHYTRGVEALFKNKDAFIFNKKGEPVNPFYDKKHPDIVHYIIPIETFGFYRTSRIPITSDWILYGDREIESLVNRICWHMDNNEWRYSREEVDSGMSLRITKCSEIPRLKFNPSQVKKPMVSAKKVNTEVKKPQINKDSEFGGLFANKV